MTAIAAIVVWAFFHSGGLKAGVPFEIASVPVIALQPSANARMSRRRLKALDRDGNGRDPGDVGGWPIAVRTSPIPTRSRTLPTKM